MSATEALRWANIDNWTAATTDALADRSLEREKMAGYLQHDYLFVEAFVRLLASAVATGSILADFVPVAQFLCLICGLENTYFLRSMEALDVPSMAVPAPETCAFQSLMDETRLSGCYENMQAVLVVAGWIYLDWARPVENCANDLPFWLGEWITLHAGEGFADVVTYLRAQLNQVYPQLDADSQAEVTRLFSKAVSLERAFF